MKVLIIGGTRFIGPPVVRKLHAQGHTVTLFHRGQTTVELPPEITHIYGDRHNLEKFKDEFTRFKPDVVLDMIPITEEDAQQVVNAFQGIAQRVVAISSQDVYRAYGIMINIEHDKIEEGPQDENAPLRQKLYPYRGEKPRKDDDPQRILDDYDKILVEKVVMNDPALPGTVMRLPMVYGPGDNQHRLFEYLKRMDDKRPAIILEETMAQWRWSRSYVENVASAIVLAVTDKRAAKRIYNVAEPEGQTLAEWVKKIGQVTGWQGQVITAPLRKLPESMRPGFNTQQHLVVDTSRLRKELDYQEEVSVDVALAATIAWERGHPPPNIDPAAFDYAAEDEILNTFGARHRSVQ
jgi:nucleoside-diphosphate-sugar epimerase